MNIDRIEEIHDLTTRFKQILNTINEIGKSENFISSFFMNGALDDIKFKDEGVIKKMVLESIMTEGSSILKQIQEIE